MEIILVAINSANLKIIKNSSCKNSIIKLQIINMKIVQMQVKANNKNAILAQSRKSQLLSGLLRPEIQLYEIESNWELNCLKFAKLNEIKTKHLRKTSRKKIRGSPSYEE